MPPPPPDAENSPSRLGMGLLLAWLFLAAVGQVFFLAQWPMYLWGVPVGGLPAIGVALVRMGAYSTLLWQVAGRRRSGWAGASLELARTFLAFMAVVVQQRADLTTGDFYPAQWAQGLLSGALPILFIINAALWSGWRPDPEFGAIVAAGTRILALVTGFGTFWLQGFRSWFGVAAEERGKVLFRTGLPLVLVVLAAETLAVWLAVRGGS